MKKFDEKNQVCIYKITNKFNDKIYIGKTKQLHTRIVAHHSVKNKSKSSINKAFREFGIENFKFIPIFVVFDEEDLSEFETYFIKEFQSNNPEFGYNMTSGGEGGVTTLNYYWINNGIDNKYISPITEMLEGYVKGRVPKKVNLYDIVPEKETAYLIRKLFAETYITIKRLSIDFNLSIHYTKFVLNYKFHEDIGLEYKDRCLYILNENKNAKNRRYNRKVK